MAVEQMVRWARAKREVTQMHAKLKRFQYLFAEYNGIKDTTDLSTAMGFWRMLCDENVPVKRYPYEQDGCWGVEYSCNPEAQLSERTETGCAIQRISMKNDVSMRRQAEREGEALRNKAPRSATYVDNYKR